MEARTELTEAAICSKPCKTLSNIKDDLTRPNKQSIVEKEASQAMQRLSPREEEALRDWIIQLAAWGWPVQVWQLHAMASSLLIGKGNTKLLEIN